MSEEIKPCPFCGTSRTHIEVDKNEEVWTAECLHPICGAEISKFTWKEVMEAWNKRAKEG